MVLFSNYGDLPDISYQLSYPSLFFAILTPLVIIARFASRKSFSGKLGSDDWVILVSALLAEVVSIQMILLCEWAFGKHISQLKDKAMIAKTLKVYFVAQILYKVNIGLTKISILLLYLKIFVTKWFQNTCLTWIGLVLAFTTGSVLSSIFQCTPVNFAFDKTLTGTCINLTAFWYANAAFNILSDLVIIFLPIPVISKLQLPLQQRILLCGIFAVGFFVCVTSILRITTLNVATSHLDTTWNSIPSSMWTIIESNLGILCASLPAFRRPLANFFPAVMGRIRGTTYNSNSRSRNHDLYAPRAFSSAAPQSVDGWNELQESGSTTHSQKEILKTTQVAVQYDDDLISDDSDTRALKAK